MKSPQETPTRYTLGESFARTGTFTFKVATAQHCNGALNQSDLGRLFDAQRHWKGRRLTVYFGHEGLALGEFERTVYILESIEGPTGPEDSYKIVAKTPLDSVAGVKIPSGSTFRDPVGNLVKAALGIGLDGLPTEQEPQANPYFSVNAFLLANELSSDEILDRLQTKEIGLATIWCLNGEAVRVQPEEVNGGYNIRLLERAVCGSTLKPHPVGTELRPAFVIPPHEHVAETVKRILIDYADLNQVFLLCCDDQAPVTIDLDSFEEYKCHFPDHVSGETIAFCKSTDAAKMLNSLAESYLFGLIDDRGVIRMQGVHPALPNNPPQILTQDEVVKYTEKLTGGTDSSYGAVNYSHTAEDCTKSLFSDDNLLDNTSYINDEFLKLPCDRHVAPVSDVKTIIAPWFNRGNQHLAHINAMRWCRIMGASSKEICIEMDTINARRFIVGNSAILNIRKNIDYRREFKGQEWIIMEKRKIGDGSCTQVCFRESPFAGIEPCFESSITIPVLYDPAECFNPAECLEVW